MASARFITYSIVGGLAYAALRTTPQLPHAVQNARPENLLSYFSWPLGQPASAAEVQFEPQLIVASDKDKIDTLLVSGVIRSNLYNAIDEAAGEHLSRSARNGLAFNLADIFEYRVDMSRDLQDGDKFHVLVERLEKPNGAILVNKILGAKLALSGNELEAIHFNSAATSGQYFDQTGKSLRAPFLRAPLTFRRISSVFGLRFHPILGAWRNHKGTDYAAAMGTPVRTVGDGVVIFAGWKGGYGNAIDVRHRNGFVTRYGHMRNFARGIHSGTRVKIGETIGFVGMTGLATGPHLHFEVIVNGVQHDPRVALRSKAGDPIPLSERALFDQIRLHTMESLASDKLADIQ